MKRADSEKTKYTGSVIVEARKKIDGAINKIVEETAQKMEAAVSEMAENTLAELKPWIEQEKAHHLRKTVKTGRRGLERIERLWDSKEPAEPTLESCAS